jgi:hypothetical protein
MTYQRSEATRERMRIAALLRPRNASGLFVKKEPDNGETGHEIPKVVPKPAVSEDDREKNITTSRRTAAPRKTKSSRKTLVARVSKSIERELFAVEQLLGDNGAPPAHDAETERRARTLASLARTLRELSQLQQADKKQKTNDDDSMPRDVNELRRELARKLDALIADAQATYPDILGRPSDGCPDS